MPATTLPIRPESCSPNLRTTVSASKMQPDRSSVALQDSEVNAFQHHITLSSISASKMENVGVPDGLIAMEPSQASRTAEDFPVLCTNQKDAEKSGSVLHHATPAALPDHTPLLQPQEGKVDAMQRHTTGWYLGRLPSSSTTNKDVAALSHSRIDSAPEVFGEMPTSGTGTTSSAASTSPPTTPSAEAQVRAEASIIKNMPRAVIDLKRRLDAQQECDRTSFDTIKGELARLSSMAAQLAVSIGKQSSAVASSFVSSPSSPLGASFVEPAAIISSTTATSASMLPAAPAYVAPQVFDKMATPSSEHGTQATTPNYCDGHQTPIQSTSVPVRNDNLIEHNVDGMLQAYGLHNLNCQTMVRADSTEYNYYALPENYPLERAIPEPLFSDESVGVFASNPGQQPYEEEHQEGDRLLKCSSKALETDHTGACLEITSDVRRPSGPDTVAPTTSEVVEGFGWLEIKDGSRRLDKYATLDRRMGAGGVPAPADGFEKARLAEAVLRNGRVLPPDGERVVAAEAEGVATEGRRTTPSSSSLPRVCAGAVTDARRHQRRPLRPLHSDSHGGARLRSVLDTLSILPRPTRGC